jgi:hypothetical protein
MCRCSHSCSHRPPDIEKVLEAPPGFEPGMEVLQTSALPLGDGAGRNWGSKLTWNVRPRLQTRPTATNGGSEDLQLRTSSGAGRNVGTCFVASRRQSARNGAADEAAAWWSAQEDPQGPTFQYWSGKRDSNPRLRPWQGRTLPLSYSRLTDRAWRATGYAPPLPRSSNRTTPAPDQQGRFVAKMRNYGTSGYSATKAPR